MTARRCIVLLLDPPGRQGHAGVSALADDADRLRAVACLRAIWPRQPIVVVPWAADAQAHGADDPDNPSADVVVRPAPFFTDAKRLAFVGADRVDHVIVVRPGALLLPVAVLRDLVSQARARSLDVAVLSGVPGDVCYVVRGETIALLASLPPVPGTTTLPQAVERLADTTPGGIPFSLARVAVRDRTWMTLAAAIPASFWKSPGLAALLSLPSTRRLAAAVRQQQVGWADARASIRANLAAPAADCSTDGRGVPVLVVLPSPYQTGAHSAWSALLPHLSPANVAFIAGRCTALHAALEARGFGVHDAPEGLGGPSAIDTAALLAALDAHRPSVVHLDGAECNAWAGLLAARGAKVVQHLRLNDVERFRPAFPYVDAIVGVSRHLCDEVRRRTDSAMRVEHIPDGVCLETCTLPPDGASHARDVLVCLCVGRVEPAKDQMRVLDIFEALRARVACRLVFVGPCGSDAAYCDEVLERIREHTDDVVQWRPFASPMARLYRDAQVVLAASRNEALGMVGLEALAAGTLLVAQRSTGYESIISPDQRDGLLFDRHESAYEVASRIETALRDFPTYSVSARRTAVDQFGAGTTADRLLRLWRELAPADPRLRR